MNFYNESIQTAVNLSHLYMCVCKVIGYIISIHIQLILTFHQCTFLHTNPCLSLDIYTTIISTIRMFIASTLFRSRFNPKRANRT